MEREDKGSGFGKKYAEEEIGEQLSKAAEELPGLRSLVKTKVWMRSGQT